MTPYVVCSKLGFTRVFHNIFHQHLGGLRIDAPMWRLDQPTAVSPLFWYSTQSFKKFRPVLNLCVCVCVIPMFMQPHNMTLCRHFPHNLSAFHINSSSQSLAKCFAKTVQNAGWGITNRNNMPALRRFNKRFTTAWCKMSALSAYEMPYGWIINEQAE